MMNTSRLTTPTASVAVAGEVRYLSAAGDDAADGRTPQSAWRTVEKMNAGLPAGGTALLRRGDVFYGGLRLPAGTDAAHPTVLADYGTGPKPVLSSVKIIRSDPSVWQGPVMSRWRVNLADPANYEGSDTLDCNPGFLLVDGEIKAWRRYCRDDVVSPWDFCGEDDWLHVHAPKNPALLAKDIRVALNVHGVTFQSHTVISNIAVRATGAHGMVGGWNPDSICEDVRISDCDFENIGGSELPHCATKTRVRYGNGVEFGSNCRNAVVERCTFKGTYDVAVTMQGHPTLTSWSDIHVRDCTMTDCTQAFEVWCGKAPDGMGFERCSFTGNRTLRVGGGWGPVVRPVRACATPLLVYGMETDTVDITVSGNTFEDAPWGLLYKSGGLDKMPAGYRIGDNVLIRIRSLSALSPAATYAAEEYAAWTAKLTGGKAPELEIVRDDTLGEDGFRLRNVGGRLEVSGGRRGVLYGVYEALERFGGIEWLSAGTTVVPANGAFRLPEGLDEVQKPAFELRQPLWYDVMHDADLAARMKLNSSQLQERHGGCSHLFDTKLGNCHTFEWLVPQKDYWKDHPEYYSEWEGKRRKGKTQLCLTNPDVLRIVTEKVLERIEANPGAKYFGISQNDWGFYCTCANCAAVDAEEESHAGTVIRFVNAVADEVAKRHPDKVIETLAYQWSRKPPKKTRVRANVMPCLCSIECEFGNPLATSEFAANRSFMDDLRGWAAQTDQLYVWDYTTDYADYLYPFPNVLVLQDNIRTFRANKVKSLFEQGAYQGRHADFAELKTWLLAKWMWNPDQPLEPLLKRFFDGYYGAAAPVVRRYFDELHALPRKGEAGNPLSIYESAYAPSMTDDFLEHAARLWDEAGRLVKDDPVRSYNVRMGRLPVDVTRLLRHRDVAKRWSEYRTLAARTLAAFDEAKTIRISEAEKYDEETLSDWRRMAECATFADAAKDLSVDTFGRRSPSFAMNRFLFETGKAYTLRVHVRGGGFEAGVSEWDSDRSMGRRKVEAKDLQNDGWAWFDIFTWQAQDRACFWFNPLDEKTEIDRVELVPCADAAPLSATSGQTTEPST